MVGIASPREPSSVLLLSIFDIKTRFRRDFPPRRDSFGSRLQVMFYHRLLSSLFMGLAPADSLAPTFSFDEFWQIVGVDPFLPFPPSFMRHLETLRSPDGAPLPGSFQNIQGIVDAWHQVFSRFGRVDISASLALLYYRQGRLGGCVLTSWWRTGRGGS